jgi:Uma2 family endonuclease
LLLRQILQGWGATAAVALGSLDSWVKALSLGFEIPISGAASNISEMLDEFQPQIAGREYHPEDLIAGFRGDENNHNAVRQHLTTALWQVAKLVGGRCMGRDFVMRLGNNGFTPDLLFFTGKDRNQLFSWYLGGPAELVVEILRSGHEYADRIVKQDYYATAGVPEYWIIDPKSQQVEFWRLSDRVYQQQFPELDERYRPSSIPGLAFFPASLWREEDWYRGGLAQEMFILEAPEQTYKRIPSQDDGLSWGCLPFNPCLRLEPVPIAFEQYISWCPEAKFEFWDGRPQIGGDIGIRHLIGMLLMTFGLSCSVKVLSPQAWVSALRERVALEQQDTERKAAWWSIARQAAALLRATYRVTRVGIIGDLVRPQPLNYWSNITLVAWDVPERKGYEIYQALSNLSKEPKLRLLEPDDYMTMEEKQAIAHELIEI